MLPRKASGDNHSQSQPQLTTQRPFWHEDFTSWYSTVNILLLNLQNCEYITDSSVVGCVSLGWPIPLSHALFRWRGEWLEIQKIERLCMLWMEQYNCLRPWYRLRIKLYIIVVVLGKYKGPSLKDRKPKRSMR